MARPQKNNCEYFPHLTTMRNHRKVKALRNKFGPVLGYAFWAMFIEYLTELDGNEFEFTQIECEMFAAELGVSATEIQSLINFCIDIELLFKDESNFIYSDSLNDALKPVYEKRNRERGKSKARERHENGSFCKKEYKSHGVSATEIPQEPPLQDAEIPQSKVKKSKVEKRKIEFDFSFVEDSFKDIFEIWLNYKSERKEKYKTQDSIQACYNHLKKISYNNPEIANEIVEKSLANNWAGIFELKNTPNGTNQKSLQPNGFEINKTSKIPIRNEY